MTTLKIAAWVIVAGALAWAFLAWSAHHDAQTFMAAERYAECVREKYGVEAYQWRAEHGEYPRCP